ncbi:GMC family oxidoreductase N-terminal domain-containing protein [Castellaniella sp. MT123]|uniref:GMC family oxidoreductase n=1 Tax=Castellaniella sp. MT123 TaxID=3140381 RepID=UPI0031F4288A
MQEYDYVIVGGGTAGCILANRLTASGKHRVLLLEAGGEGRGFWIPIPAGFSKLLVDPRFNWRFETAPEPNTLDRVIAVPRGKGLGGSSLINGMIYVRGQPADYDHWQALGAQGWGWADVEPYFRKLENYAQGGAARGHDGPMYLSEVGERHVLADALLEAAAQAGQPRNADYNAGEQEGFGYYQVLQRQGRRWSVTQGYLDPARSRANLTVHTQAQVLGLDLDESRRRCVGVSYLRQGQRVQVRARTEVILAAGTVQSPQILELSGIGDPGVLQSIGVPVRHALPAVGENYIDHFCTRMNWRVRHTQTLNELTRGWRLGRAVSEYFTRHTGILTLGTGLVFGFVKNRSDLPAPDVQYFFMHASYANAAERKLDHRPGMTLGVAQLRPQSVGSIHARSADPAVGPVIRPNFLDCTGDQDSLIGGMQLARRIMGQPAMARYVEQELNPGAQTQSRDDWLRFARENGQTIYHPIGTCRMGSDAASVVDTELRVRGLDGLRVVDASVVPAMVSGNTQGVVMMVAEKGADLILQAAARQR